MKNTIDLNQNDIGKNNKSLWSVFGPVFAALLCIIVFILFRFYNASLEETKEDVKNQMTSKQFSTVHDASLVLGQIMAAGNVAGGMLADDGVNYSHWAETVNHIYSSNSNIYLVTIVDNKGKGVSSISDEEVNLSGYTYYKESDEAYYKIVGNDGVTSNPALVCVVPIAEDGSVIGYINQYMDITNLSKLLPIEGEGSNNGLFVMKQSGDIVYKRGFLPISVDDNLFGYLAKSTLDGSIDKIINNVKYNITQSYIVKSGDKRYMFISIPMNVGEWTCVHVLEVSYTDMLVDSKIKVEKNLINSLTLLCILTVALIITLFAISRARQRQLNKALENKADTDLLTGMYNKISTERKIVETLTYEKNEQHMMVLFDIDNFKKINDTMGHAFGDQVLKTLGEELSQEFRKSDILGRTGGDEFTLLIKDLKSDEILNKECDKLVAFFNQFKAGDYVKYSATASIGVAIYPRDGSDFAALYKAADHALYDAKKQGKNRLVCYNQEFNEKRVNGNKKPVEEGNVQ